MSSNDSKQPQQQESKYQLKGGKETYNEKSYDGRNFKNGQPKGGTQTGGKK